MKRVKSFDLPLSNVNLQLLHSFVNPQAVPQIHCQVTVTTLSPFATATRIFYGILRTTYSPISTCLWISLHHLLAQMNTMKAPVNNSVAVAR